LLGKTKYNNKKTIHAPTITDFHKGNPAKSISISHTYSGDNIILLCVTHLFI